MKGGSAMRSCRGDVGEVGVRGTGVGVKEWSE